MVPDADEANGGAGLRVVTPNRNPARRATRNLLTLAARRGRPDEFGLASRVYDTIGLIESIERMRGAGLTLAPATMASMNNQRHANQPISDLSTCAPAFHVWLHQRLLVMRRVPAVCRPSCRSRRFSKQHVKSRRPLRSSPPVKGEIIAATADALKVADQIVKQCPTARRGVEEPLPRTRACWRCGRRCRFAT